MKTCIKCHKNENRRFHKSSTSKDGTINTCTDCVRVHGQNRYLIDKVNIGYRNKKNYIENKEMRSADGKKYYEDNKEKIKQRVAAYRKNNRIKALEADRKYREKNKAKLNLYHKNRLKNDLNFKIAHNLRVRVNKAIRNNQKTGSAVQDLGCSIDYLRQHLEAQFVLGTAWSNYGFGLDKWNIDHINPLAGFDLSNRDHFLKSCHYTNLQPLWTIDNIRKGSRCNSE